MLVLAANASAQSVWDGGSVSDNNWNSADNWVGDVAPVSSGTTELQFDGITRLSATNNFTNGSVFRTITFNAGAGAFTLSGNNIGTTGIAHLYTVTNNSSQVQTVNMNYAYSASSTAGILISTAVGGGALHMGGNVSGGSSNNNFSLSLSNTTGISTIRLTGTNTSTSNTPVTTGNRVNVVEVGTNSAFSGIVRFRGPQLVAFGGDRTISRPVEIGVAAINSPGVNLIITGENAFTFGGSFGLGTGASTVLQSSVIFDTSALTTFAAGITTPTGGSSSQERITNLAGSGDVLISGNIANGSGGIKGALAWNNAAALSITGTVTATGRMDLMAGSVTLDYSTNDTSKLVEGPLNLGGSKISMVSGTHAELVTSSTMVRGATTVTRTSGSATLNLNAITRANGNGATISFAADGIATTDRTNTNDILGGWAVVGNNWAVNSTNGADGAITGLASYQSDINATGTNNVALTGSASLSASGTRNSLKLAPTGAGNSLDLGVGNTLGLVSGGLLFTGTNAYSMDNGTLAATTSGDDLKVFVVGSGDLTINSTIANGSGTNGLTKSGPGTLVLGNSNTFSGPVVINQGAVSVASAGALGSGTSMAIHGGTLDITQSMTITRAAGFVLGADGGTIRVAAGQTATLDGALINASTEYTDTTLGSLTKSGVGTLVTTDSNTYTGATTLNAGVLSVSSIKDGAELYSGSYGAGGSAASGIGASTSSYRNLVFNSGTLRYTGAATSSNRGFTIGTNGGTIDASGSGALNFTGGRIFLSGSNTARTFQLAGSNSGTNTLGASLGDNGSGATSLTKSGTGRWVLSGTNGYTGATTVSAGTLEIAQAGVISDTSAVTVSAGASFVYNSSAARAGAISLNGAGVSGAVLSGTGAINVGLTLDNAGDTLSPGNSPGVMPFAVGQSWSAFTYVWETNNFTGVNAGSDFDQITIAGSLSLSGSSGAFTLDLRSLTAGNVAGDVPNFSEMTRSWTILSTTGGITGFNSADWTILDSGFTSSPGWTDSWSLARVGNDLVLTYAIPEPGALALVMVSGVALLLRRRSRKQK